MRLPATRPERDMEKVIVRETVFTDEFCKKEGRVIYAVALRILGDKEKARDVVQDVWLRALKYGAGFQGEAERTTYLYKMTANECFRFQKSDKTGFGELDDEPVLPEDDGPLRQVELANLAQAVDRCIERLTPLQKAAISYYIHGGLPYKEIARMLGVSDDGVASLIARARTRIKKFLDL